MRLALVADWLPTYAGAEHVIAEFLRLWPSAPLFTTVANRGNLGPLDSADIRTSRLQRLYRLTHDHKVLLPLMPRAIESIDLRGYDIVISSSHAVGKGIIPPSDAVHICYCHTPMRYAWEMEDQYLEDFRIPKRLRGRIKWQLKKLRRWDLTTAKRVERFIANSKAVQERIKRIYNRESIVVPPPVAERFLQGRITNHESRITSPYFLAIGRLVPYKKFDLLIETANAMKLPLKIVGKGQQYERLKRMAGPTVELLGRVPDEDLTALYANASALLFPQIEDAGVAPLEAQACGTPIIGLKAGGALDIIEEGVNGMFFEEQTVESLRSALERFSDMQFDRKEIRERARKYGAEVFRSSIGKIVEERSKQGCQLSTVNR